MADSTRRKKGIRTYGNNEIEVVVQKAIPPDAPRQRLYGVQPGHHRKGLCHERDVPIKLRNGVTICTECDFQLATANIFA